MIQNLAKQAEISIDEKFGVKAWINSAHQLKKNALLDKLDGKLESSYRNFMKYCNIILQLPKHSQFSSIDASLKNEFLSLKKEVPDILNVLESLKTLILQQKPALPPPQTPPKSQGNVVRSTPNKISASHLLRYFVNGSPPKLLVLDTRPYQEFVGLHFAGASVCHIPQEILGKKCSALEILNKLPKSPEFHRVNFSLRHDFQLIVYLDGSSTTQDQSVAMQNLANALSGDQTGQYHRTPALLVGGFEAWKNAVRTCSMRLPLLKDGDVDGKDEKKPSNRSSENVNYINRTPSDYLASALGSSGPKAPPRSIPSSSYSLEDASGDAATSKRNSVFDSPFFNFASASHLKDDVNYEIPSQHTKYYPDASAPPLRQSSASTSSNSLQADLPLHLRQPLNIPIALPRNYLSSTVSSDPPPLPSKSHPSQPPVIIQNDSEEPAPSRVARKRLSMVRAPSPPSPGNASSHLLTIHPMNEELLSNLRGAWKVAGGSMGRGFVGLKNLGNTCFMNSILQCLMATRPLSLLFYDGSYRRLLNIYNPMGSKGKLTSAYCSLLTMIYREENGVVVSPSSFKEVVGNVSAQFRGSEQHDSQEFLAFLLDGLHEDLNQGIRIKGGKGYLMTRLPDWIQPDESKEDDLEEEKLPENISCAKAWYRYLQRNDSPIVHWFQGQMKSQLKCSVCAQTSTTFNPFMYLSLPIPDRGSGKLRLADCLNEYIKEETLDESDSWRCPKCKLPRRATKKMTISRLPTILLIHLKRFSFSGPFRNKLETMIDYPVNNLDVFPYLSDSLRKENVGYYERQGKKDVAKPNSPHRFDLYAVSNHFGGLNGGHYTATIRHSGKGAWFYFDDSRVSEIGKVGAVDQEKICTRAAYSLFYVSHSVS